MNIIELENLSKQFRIQNKHQGLLGSIKDLFSNDYKIVNAVNDLSFEVKAGEIIGFVGPNGAGKSTTIKMMTGVLKPTSGKLTVNGYIPFQNRTKYVQEIGVVFGQRTQLWWDLPVIESFKILKEIYKIDNKTFKNSIDLFVKLVDLDRLFHKTVRSMSLGQRMLCDITASFLHNPKIIFLDEPTIGLDISVKVKIRQLIKALNEIKGSTIILTTHDMQDIEALCKRIIIIDKGTLLFDGNIENVTKIFGSHRILKIESHQLHINHDELEEGINFRFGAGHINVEEQEDGWISIVFDGDEIKIMELLNYLIGEYFIRDIKIEEIKLESIIKRIYEGGLV